MTQEQTSLNPPQKTAYFALISAQDDLSNPAQIKGWPTLDYDADSTPPSYEAPDGYKAFPLPDMTAQRWDELRFKENGLGGGIAYFKGDMVPYTPPPYVLPLKEQAQNAYGTVQRQAAMVSAMGEEFGHKMKTYVRALRAIIDGSDTTITGLPTAPDDVTT